MWYVLVIQNVLTGQLVREQFYSFFPKFSAGFDLDMDEAWELYKTINTNSTIKGVFESSYVEDDDVG